MMQKWAVQVYHEDKGDMVDVVMEADIDERGEIFLKLQSVPDGAVSDGEPPMIYMTDDVASSVGSALRQLSLEKTLERVD